MRQQQDGGLGEGAFLAALHLGGDKPVCGEQGAGVSPRLRRHMPAGHPPCAVTCFSRASRCSFSEAVA